MSGHGLHLLLWICGVNPVYPVESIFWSPNFAPEGISAPSGCPGEHDVEGGYDVEIDLQTGNILGEDRSINLMYNDGVASQSCNIQAVFNVTFDSHENASNPNLHRRLLVDLWFTNPENWVFHIGDSQSNDGNMGDAGHQLHNSELQGTNKKISIYGSDDNKGQATGMIFEADNFYSKRLTLIIEDSQVAWNNHGGNFNIVRSRNLFALSGQLDKKKGGVNYDIYIAMNRVVSTPYKSGMGLCRAALKWLPYFT